MSVRVVGSGSRRNRMTHPCLLDDVGNLDEELLVLLGILPPDQNL